MEKAFTHIENLELRAHVVEIRQEVVELTWEISTLNRCEAEEELSLRQGRLERLNKRLLELILALEKLSAALAQLL